MAPAKKKGAGREEFTRSRESTGKHVKLAVTRVLIVDDVLDNRDLYAEFLRFKGFEIVTAENGEEALEIAASRRLDIVIMDLALPVLDGWEATRRLKSDERTAAIPVIVLTGHDESAHRQRALDAGCDVYLTKPRLPQDLYEVIMGLLATGEHAREA